MTHPKYNAHTVDNDIALLHLPRTLSPSDYTGIACLPAPWQDLPSDQLCTIIGWGKANASDEFGTDVLHEAKVEKIYNLREFKLLNLICGQFFAINVKFKLTLID